MRSVVRQLRTKWFSSRQKFIRELAGSLSKPWSTSAKLRSKGVTRKPGRPPIFEFRNGGNFDFCERVEHFQELPPLQVTIFVTPPAPWCV